MRKILLLRNPSVSIHDSTKLSATNQSSDPISLRWILSSLGQVSSSRPGGVLKRQTQAEDQVRKAVTGSVGECIGSPRTVYSC